MNIVSVTVFVMPFFTIKLRWSYFLDNSFGSYFEYMDLGHNYSTRCLVIFIANCYVIHLTGFSFPVSELPAYQNADVMDNLHVYPKWGFSVPLHRNNTSNTVLVINLGLALLTLSWDKNWDSHSPMNGYPSFYPRIALVAPSPGGILQRAHTAEWFEIFNCWIVLWKSIFFNWNRSSLTSAQDCSRSLSANTLGFVCWKEVYMAGTSYYIP